jgi:hypothetical protein
MNSDVNATPRIGAPSAGQAPTYRCANASKPVRQRNAEVIVFLGGLLVGLAFASYLYGWNMVDGTHVGWLLHGGDMSSHFLGWDAFRRDGWHWPPGANPKFGYITRNSIVFSDSLPLLALPLKLVQSYLPDPFQYQGLILFGNFMFNGAFAALLAYRLSSQTWAALIVAALVAAGTVVTSRGYGGHGHETLTAHWLVLAAFTLAWTGRNVQWEHRRYSWLLLIAVSALTHFYLLLMVLVIWVVDVLSFAVATHRSWPRIVRHGSAVAALLFAVMYVAGYFHGPTGVPTAAGFGNFSANLLTFLDPASTAWYFGPQTGVASMSTFLPDLPEHGSGQYEGHAYMGAGILVVVAVGGLCRLRDHAFRFSRGASALMVSASILALLAFSNVVAVGNWELVNLPLMPPIATLAGVVRASGRFIWVPYYLLIFGAFASIARTLPRRATLGLLALALVVQLADLAPWHGYLRHASRTNLDVPHLVEDPDVNRLVAGSARMIFLPVTDAPEGYVLFSYIAARHGVAVNATYSARVSEAMLARANVLETRRLLSGDIGPDEVFVVSEAAGITATVCTRATMLCQRISERAVLMRARAGLTEQRQPAS